MPRVSLRHKDIPGWNQESYAQATGLFIGAGGINGEIVEGAVRKGLGIAHVVDFDNVEPTNLNRQKFTTKDLFKNKAIRLCKNLSKQGFLGTRLIAHACSHRELDITSIQPSFCNCGIDLQIPNTRVELATLCYNLGIPIVFEAVSTDADLGYVFVQESKQGTACWACAFKPEFNDELKMKDKMCPGVPACCDILKVVAGNALYAIDTLIMDRKRDWNFRRFSFSNSRLIFSNIIEPRANCPVCGVKEIEK